MSIFSGFLAAFRTRASSPSPESESHKETADHPTRLPDRLLPDLSKQFFIDLQKERPSEEPGRHLHHYTLKYHDRTGAPQSCLVYLKARHKTVYDTQKGDMLSCETTLAFTRAKVTGKENFPNQMQMLKTIGIDEETSQHTIIIEPSEKSCIETLAYILSHTMPHAPTSDLQPLYGVYWKTKRPKDTALQGHTLREMGRPSCGKMSVKWCLHSINLLMKMDLGPNKVPRTRYPA
ncbi:hypothetical protein M231_01246 [Tremella mesenterica]|uniref:Uncharacterized protein n=1 Tax=Tremella mesenterica TaxID=5217 RepID=A0A4Q1BU43_TREME|nr:uncharacterized protein TREMEDRAFT_64125 [Tremella mesenterica DSM 1558]EIW67536.1 hypothetical protein TREMEDRAFT_64125 [Tremella mesenterica DSM 1558]RXK41538.1 hypothetical protein M231_01246 [Tremella mesenterica]